MRDKAWSPAGLYAASNLPLEDMIGALLPEAYRTDAQAALKDARNHVSLSCSQGDCVSFVTCSSLPPLPFTQPNIFPSGFPRRAARATSCVRYRMRLGHRAPTGAAPGKEPARGARHLP